MKDEALKIALDYIRRTSHWEKGRDRHDTLKAVEAALAQPEQMREAYASITIRVGNRYIQQFVTQEMFLSAKEPWWLLDQYAKQCVEKLKENT